VSSVAPVPNSARRCVASLLIAAAAVSAACGGSSEKARVTAEVVNCVRTTDTGASVVDVRVVNPGPPTNVSVTIDYDAPGLDSVTENVDLDANHTDVVSLQAPSLDATSEEESSRLTESGTLAGCSVVVKQ
jgi:hypothetical protein